MTFDTYQVIFFLTCDVKYKLFDIILWYLASDIWSVIDKRSLKIKYPRDSILCNEVLIGYSLIGE